MQKEIKTSKRGLTFCFAPQDGKFLIGDAFKYVIDKDSGDIRISLTGDRAKHTVSRKRAGAGYKSLIDLRAADVRAAISGMKKLSIVFQGDQIIVSDAKRKATVIAFPRRMLAGLRMAAGISDSSAVNAFYGEQVTFDDYLRSQPIELESMRQASMDVFTVVSLFSGAGIFDYPFSIDPDFAIQFAIDYDAAACETYRKNIGTHIVCGDVHRAFDGTHAYPLENMVEGRPDIVIGGPSCKPFSNSNRHLRLEQHPDSDLLAQYMRIVKVLKPKVFAIENVPEVLSACDGAYFRAVCDSAADAGYELKAEVVRDCDLGGYTTRKRVIILGSAFGETRFAAKPIVAMKTAGDALRQVTPEWANYGDVTVPRPETRERMSYVPQGGNYKDIPERLWTESSKTPNRHSCTYHRLALNEPSPTIVNWRKPPLIHPTKDRTLTVAEAKALHGLPGDFKVCGSLGQMQQQVGNSVPVAIGRYIKKCLREMLSQQKQLSLAAT